MHEMLQGNFGGRRRMGTFARILPLISANRLPPHLKQMTYRSQKQTLTIAPRLGLKTNVYQQIQYQLTIFVYRAISTTLTSNKKLATSRFISLMEEQHGVKEFYFLFNSWITHLKSTVQVIERGQVHTKKYIGILKSARQINDSKKEYDK